MNQMKHKTPMARLIHAAIVPTVAIGLSIGAQAQSTAPTAGDQSTAAAAQGQAAQNTAYRGLRASQVIGMSVRNSQGNNIGQIDDMIVDMNTGQVRYAMLSFDPGILSGEKLFAVPVDQLRMAPDRDDVVYDVSREKLEQATVDRSEWNSMTDEQRIARVDKAWGLARPGEGARAHRASDLIGKEVNSRSGEQIGEIEDLVINMAQQEVHYAVMEFDAGWASPERRYVFPLRSFDLGRDRDELVLNVDKSKVQAMKSFDQNLYSDLNDRTRVAEIDRYFVTVLPTVVATTGGNAGNATASSAGAVSQSQARTDVQGGAGMQSGTQAEARTDTDTTRMGAGSQDSSFNDVDTDRNTRAARQDRN